MIMKKNKFFVLASLCGVLAGMPAKACEIKDSAPIGGAGGSFNKQKCETLDKANLKEQSKQNSKFLKYFLKSVLSLCAIEGTHEGLSYLFGNKGQFYEKPAQYSLVGMYRNGNEVKINELITEFQRCTLKTNAAGDIMKELQKIFSEQEQKKLREISEVKDQKGDGYEFKCPSWHSKNIPEEVLRSILGLLNCKYPYESYKDKLEFFLVHEYESADYFLFCCPKNNQELCERLENKFFQRQNKYEDKQKEILKKYNDVELYSEYNFVEELLKNNKNLDLVGKLSSSWGDIKFEDIGILIKFDTH